ncbi:MAG: hypothetical protein ABI234_02315 [Ktedonobacteraceae bacterium]
MQTISCPTCGEPLPEAAKHCIGCGKGEPLAETTVRLLPASSNSKRANPIWQAARRALLADSETLLLKPSEADVTTKLAHKEIANRESGQKLVDEPEEEELLEEHGTWQKVVTTTPHSLPALLSQESEHRTFRRFMLSKQRTSPRSFWLGLVVLFALLLSIVFGVAMSLKHVTPLPVPPQPVLQASPATIALGGIVTLRGAHFTPDSTLTLGRDHQLQLVDTGGVNNIQTDMHGAFSDTVIIDPNWLAGKHVLYVTGARTHQQASFSLMVTGQSALQGPPHLLLSADTLDFGAGDELTNSNQPLAISNAGGGQLTWQASSGQSWLQISPASGTVASGVHMSVIVAIDRSKLNPNATYNTSIIFTSNTEQITLPVSMSVIPLQPGHQAALQLSPAALTFNATVSGPEPQPQTITVNNPGVQPLTWGMTIAFQNNNSHWLFASSQTGLIAPGGQQQIVISINIRGLSSGIYKGTLIFANQGPKPIQGSPQSIFVSLTVAPLCTLILAPSNLSFASVHGQASPAAQALQVSVVHDCTTSQRWNATSATVKGGNWLSISQSSGSTPAQPRINVNTAGLTPGTYTGTLTFTAHAGQQIVPVSLNIIPITCTLTAQSMLAVQGIAGQSSQSSQNATLGSTGDCPNALNWTSMATINTPSGGTWLSATSSGSFTPPAGANPTVQANLTGLGAGTYSGTVRISAVDSVTSQSVGIVQIAITLTVLPQCVLQAPSATSLPPFTANAGSNPTTNTASFTISATGTCTGNITITPSVDAGGNGWLGITGPVSIASGGTATFTTTITSNALAAGTYSSTITLNAADGNGNLSGSPQQVNVSLTVLVPCTLQAPSATTLPFTAAVGSNPTTNTVSFTISVTGNCAGNVTITPSVDAGGNGWLAITGPISIASGGTATITVTITSSALAAGTYSSTITLNAGAISGSPQTVNVTLTVS